MLLDKGLLAIVAALVGFQLAKQLERFKRQQTGIAELFKVRIVAISDVYAAPYECRDAIIAVEEYEPGLRHGGDLVDVEAPTTAYRRAVQVVGRNRFLVGADFARAAADCLTHLGAAAEQLRQYMTPSPIPRVWDVEPLIELAQAFKHLDKATPAFARLPPEEMPKPQDRRPNPKALAAPTQLTK
jgi:hypothetical protein